MTEPAPLFDALELDPRKSNFVTTIGRKGSGKSTLTRRLWNSYPFDRICIDPTKDANPGDDVVALAPPLPARFPVDVEGKRMSLHFQPDAGSPTYRDDLDRAIGLAFHHPKKRCLAWIDETEEMGSAQQSGPSWLRALKQGRHNNLTLLCAGIRPMAINPLVLSQADYVACFTLPNPDDRKRVASAIGYPPREFDAAIEQLDEYEFLWWSTVEHSLVHCGALPESDDGKRYRRRT